MFEDSLMESQNRLSSPTQRWTTALSLTLQCSIAAAIIALPLLHPEALPFRVDVPKIMLPVKASPPQIPHVNAANNASASASSSAVGHPLTGPRITPTTIADASDAPPMTSFIGSDMGDPNGLPSAFGNSASVIGPHVTVTPANPAPKGLLHISTGVSAGLLLAPIVLVYPRIAISARVEGAVKVEAVISKSGRIESAHVVSGPEMLRQAALDAIRNAHYTPYMLNGSPTAVETLITVNFKLSN